MSLNSFVIDIIQVYTFAAHQVFLRVGHAADIDMTLTRSVYSHPAMSLVVNTANNIHIVTDFESGAIQR